MKVTSSWLDAPRHILMALLCVRLQDQMVRDAVSPYVRSGACKELIELEGHYLLANSAAAI